MRRNVFCVAVALAACLGLAASARADQKRLTTSDRDFINDAAAGGTAEVKLGQLAQAQAGSPGVRKFAEKIAEDHTLASKELASLLKKKGVSLPPKEMPKKAQATYDRLAALRGADFDRAYVKDMIDDHLEDIARFDAMAKNGKDADLRAFAIKTLPTLREHLDMAQKLAIELKQR